MKGQNWPISCIKNIDKISRYLLILRYFLMFPSDAIYCFRKILGHKTLNTGTDVPRRPCCGCRSPASLYLPTFFIVLPWFSKDQWFFQCKFAAASLIERKVLDSSPSSLSDQEGASQIAKGRMNNFCVGFVFLSFIFLSFWSWYHRCYLRCGEGSSCL